MNSDWKKAKLGSLIKFSSGGTPNKSNPAYWNGTIPWISAKAMKNDKIETSDLFITDEGLKKGSKLAQRGSLLLLVRGSGLFNGISICYVEKPVAYNQDVKCIESMSEIENKYLFYWFKANANYLKNKLELTSIGAGKFDTKFLSDLDILFPKVETRHKIISIADSITNKIEINNNINKNLAEQLRLIFKHTFIDAEHSEWPNERLGNFLSLERGLSYKGKYLSDSNGVPMINLGNILPNSVFRPEKLKFYTGDFKEKVVVKPGDIVVANTDLTQAREVLGSAIIIPDLGYSTTICSHHISIVRNCKISKHFIHGMLNSPSYRKRVIGFATGTTVLALPNETILNCEFSLPPVELINEYDLFAESIYQQSEMLRKENQQLSQLRDTLLPQLISGRIDVSEVLI